MSVLDISAPGRKAVRFDLDPRTALDVFFHLACSLQAEETTVQSRIHVAALLPQLKRAVVRTGIVSDLTLSQLQAHLAAKPAAPALDQSILSGKVDG